VEGQCWQKKEGKTRPEKQQAQNNQNRAQKAEGFIRWAEAPQGGLAERHRRPQLHEDPPGVRRKGSNGLVRQCCVPESTILIGGRKKRKDQPQPRADHRAGGQPPKRPPVVVTPGRRGPPPTTHSRFCPSSPAKQGPGTSDTSARNPGNPAKIGAGTGGEVIQVRPPEGKGAPTSRKRYTATQVQGAGGRCAARAQRLDAPPAACAVRPSGKAGGVGAPAPLTAQTVG